MSKITYCAALAFAIGFSVTLAASEANAAAFNCNYAKLPTEVLICQDDVLGPLDEVNARVFYKLKNQLTPEGQKKFNSLGRDWIKTRNGCGYNRSCVLLAYTFHIQNMCKLASAINVDIIEEIGDNVVALDVCPPDDTDLCKDGKCEPGE